MRTLLLFICSLSFFSLYAQPQIEIQHDGISPAFYARNQDTHGEAGRFIAIEDALIARSDNGSGMDTYSDHSFGINARSANAPAGFFSSFLFGQSDIVLGGNTGIITSDLSNAQSRLLLKSNGAVDIQIDDDNTSSISYFRVFGPNNTLFQIAEDGRSYLRGDLEVSALDNGDPDLELGGTSSTDDNGVLSSSQNYGSSDLVFVSNDDVAIQLDDNNNDNGELRVRNGQNTVIFRLFESGNLNIAGSLDQGSDRNRKTDITPIDGSDILNQLLAMPVYEWQYKEEDRRHIGPMAQDFHSAFQLGDDDTSISSIDADGVALVAIQELHQIIQTQSAQLELLTAKVEQLLSSK